MKAFLVVVSAVLLGGCALYAKPPIYQRQAQFNEAEYAPYGGEGTSTITGQAFLKTAGGEVRFGAGDKVYMNPVTAYSTEWWENIGSGREMSEADKRSDAYHWVTIADGEGRFKFENLQAGEYYIICPITWSVPGQYGLTTTGGCARAKVSVKPGKIVNAIVTR